MHDKRICLILTAYLVCAFLFTSCLPQVTAAPPTLTPEPTFTAVPTETPTPEPTDIPEPFIEEIPEGDSLVEKVVSAAKENLDFLKVEGGESPETENLIVVPFYVNNSKGEKNPFVMVGNNKDGSLFAAFSNEGDLINPINDDGGVIFEQLINYKQENDTLVGIPNPNGEGILTPPLFTLTESEILYTDLWTGDIIIIDQNESLGKYIRESLASLKDEWFEVVTEDMIGRNGITDYMLGGKIVSEKNQKFLVNQDGYKVGLLESNKEWVEYLDVKVVNFYENPDMTKDDVPVLWLEDITSGRWAIRLHSEIERMGLNKQNADPDLINYELITTGDGVTSFLNTDSALQLDVDTNTSKTKPFNERSFVPLFPCVVYSKNDDLYLPVITQRFAQKEEKSPYFLLNTVLFWGSGGFSEEEIKLFLPNGIFRDNVFLPLLSIGSNTPFLYEAKLFGFYDFFWNSELYGPSNKASELFDSLIETGIASKEIENEIFLMIKFINYPKF